MAHRDDARSDADRLIAEHWGLAVGIARRVARPTDWDVAESASTEALWVCARRWSGVGPFAPYAAPRIRWRVIDAIRAWRGDVRQEAGRRRASTAVWEMAAMPEGATASAEDEAMARLTLAALAGKRHVAEVVAGVASGMAHQDIAAAIGVSPSRVAQIMGECREAA